MSHSSNKKYILWDMDGTLLDSEPQHYRAWKRIFEEDLGIDVPWDLYKAAIGATGPVLDKIILDNYGIDLAHHPAKSRCSDMIRTIEDEEGFRPVKGIHEILEYLTQKGYVMAVASSASVDYIERCTGGIGIDKYFKIMFSGMNVAHSKPAPDTFLGAAEALGAKPEECVVMEDSENGTKAGQAAGMLTIGFINPGSGDQDLSAADIRIRDMSELKEIL